MTEHGVVSDQPVAFRTLLVNVCCVPCCNLSAVFTFDVAAPDHETDEPSTGVPPATPYPVAVETMLRGLTVTFTVRVGVSASTTAVHASGAGGRWSDVAVADQGEHPAELHARTR